MSLAARTSFAWFFSLLPVLGFSACSAKDTSVDSHTSGSANGTAGTQSVVGASGSGGLAGKSATGSAGSSNAGGALAQGGFSANAGSGSASVNVAGSANGGGSGNVGLGGTPGGSGSSAGSQSSSAGSAGLGNVAGAAGSSAAFTQVSTILQKNCGLKGCHADKQSPHFVPGAMLYATLTGPNTVIASCDYTKLVEAGDPSKSALVRLMNKKCGNFVMPPGCNQATCLPAADLKTLSDWIQAGAPP